MPSISRGRPCRATTSGLCGTGSPACALRTAWSTRLWHRRPSHIPLSKSMFALECDNRVVAAMTWSLHSIKNVGADLKIHPNYNNSGRLESRPLRHPPPGSGNYKAHPLRASGRPAQFLFVLSLRVSEENDAISCRQLLAVSRELSFVHLLSIFCPPFVPFLSHF